MKSSTIALIRPDGTAISSDFYNCQELGLAKNLACLGVNVDVYYASDSNIVSYTEIESLGTGIVRLIKIPCFNIPLIDLAVFPELLRIIKLNSYNLIQVNEYNELINIPILKYCKKHSIPFVINQGMYMHFSGRLHKIYQFIYNRLFLKRLITGASMLLCKTNAVQLFLSDLGFEKTKIMPIGLDTESLQLFPNDEKFNLRDHYNIPKDHKIILYVGTFEKRRNIEFLLALGRSLQQTNVTFIFIGDGECLSSADVYVKKYNLTNIILTGRLSQAKLPCFYQQSEIFLLASNYEIYGMAVLEAMYYANVVLATQTAGPESIIKQNQNGQLLDNLNVNLWQEAILNLLNDPARLEKMGSAAQQYILKELTWEVIAKKYKREVICPLSEQTKSNGNKPIYV